MDSYEEYIVKKQQSAKEKTFMLLIVLAAIAVTALLILIIPVLGSWATFIFLVLAGVIFGTWKLLQQFSREFEYIIVNFNFDVDMIVARRRRKKVVSLDLRSVEEFGPADDNMTKAYKRSGKLIDASSGSVNDTFAIQYHDTAKGKVMLLISPNQATLNTIRKYSQRKQA